MCLNFKDRQLFLSILFFLSLFSCAHNKTNSENCATCNKSLTSDIPNSEKTEKETRIFRKYLKKVFLADVNNGDIFIVIPDHPCVGCMDEAIAIFKAYRNDGAKIIVTPPHAALMNIMDKNIYLDSLGEINKLDLPLENASVLLMGKGGIENIVYTTPDQDKNIRAMIAKHLGVK